VCALERRQGCTAMAVSSGSLVVFDLRQAAKQYSDLEVSAAKRLKALEEENRRLRRLVADQALDLQFLRDVSGEAAARRTVVEQV
jgi:hypothetical protein